MPGRQRRDNLAHHYFQGRGPILHEHCWQMLGQDAVLPPEQLDQYAIKGPTPPGGGPAQRPPGHRRRLALGCLGAAGGVPREGGTQLALGNVPQDSLESAAVR